MSRRQASLDDSPVIAITASGMMVSGASRVEEIE